MSPLTTLPSITEPEVSARTSLPTLKIPLGDWIYSAACRGPSTVDFFADNEYEDARAKSVCSNCSVRQTCLEWAIDTDQEFGIWGGQDRRARNKIARRRPLPLIAA